MKSLALKLAFSLLIGAAMMAYALRGMNHDAALALGQSPSEALLGAVTSFSPWVIAGYALTFLAVHVARLLRWVLVVDSLGPARRTDVVAICAVGFAAIILFPLRIGEMVRPYLLSRYSRISFGAALATAVVERIIDGLCITGLLFAALATAPIPPSPVVRSAGWVSLAVFLGASVAIGAFAVQFDLACRLVNGVLGRWAPGLAQRVVGLMQTFLDGVRVLRAGGNLARFLGLTVVYWSMNALGMAWLARGCGLPVPWFGGFGLLSTLVVGLMVPSGPGYLGNFEVALIGGLKLYLPQATLGATAMALALVQNVVQFAVQVGFGVPFLVKLGLTPRGLVALTTASQPAAKTD